MALKRDKSFAVAIIRRSIILSVPEHRITLREAKVNSYNRVCDDCTAVIIRHLFAKAISLPNRKRMEVSANA